MGLLRTFRATGTLSVLFLSALGFVGTGAAEESRGGGFFNMSLDELLQVEVDTATVAKAPFRRQPATITVMTEEDIRALGARYLSDVLEFIPGFSQGVDVFGVTSLIFRGHWAHEGKVAFFIDDLPVNDLLYGSLNMAKHYPVEQIERVEVIRGAGTANYGGDAQLAVIRVYTKEARKNEITAHMTTDRVDHAEAGGGTVITATAVRDDLRLSLSASYSNVGWSGEIWQDNSNTDHDLNLQSSISTFNIIQKLDWNDLHLRVLWDTYHSETPQKHGDSRPGETVEFNNVNVSLEYDFKLTEHLTLTPRYVFRYQEDWWITRNPELNPISDFQLPAKRHIGSLELKHESDRWNYVLGAEYQEIEASAKSAGGFKVPKETYFNGANRARHECQALFFQTEVPIEKWLLSLGVRYNDHSFSGTSLVTRAGVAYDINDEWTIKGVYGEAFRDPDIEVINSSNLWGDPIEPEETTQWETELSWKPSERLFGTLALYYVTNRNPIIYTSTDAGYYYANNTESTTKGLETTWTYQAERLRLSLAYSYYTAVHTPLPYVVPQDDEQHLGAPKHKLTVSADYRLPGGRWSLLPSLVWYSDYYAYDFKNEASDTDGDEIASQKQSSDVFFNIAARYRKNDWELLMGVSDVFDERRSYPQPYNDASTPYDGPGRTMFVTCSYRWGF